MQSRNQGQLYNCLIVKCLSSEYLKIIDEGSFFIHYEAKDLQILLTKVLLFLEVQPEVTKLESSAGS